jgi:hypothetical protein
LATYTSSCQPASRQPASTFGRVRTGFDGCARRLRLHRLFEHRGHCHAPTYHNLSQTLPPSSHMTSIPPPGLAVDLSATFEAIEVEPSDGSGQPPLRAHDDPIVPNAMVRTPSSPRLPPVATRRRQVARLTAGPAARAGDRGRRRRLAGSVRPRAPRVGQLGGALRVRTVPRPGLHLWPGSARRLPARRVRPVPLARPAAGHAKLWEQPW